MSNLIASHFGAPPEGYDVTPLGTKIVVKDKLNKQITITNASVYDVYLAAWSVDADTNTAEVGKGIYLGPQGGACEFNNTNMCFNDIWAIVDGTSNARVCVQRGK